MFSTAWDSVESYLSRYRLRLLVDEWLEVVARTEPEDPFAYLVDLIKDYTRDGRGLVTCENKWCEMVVPVSEYAAHLKSCSEEGKWMKCARCNLRVEASHMQEHRRHCRLQCCAYCGEMVVPRLMGLCPYKLKMDAERARRRRDNADVAQGDKAGAGETCTTVTLHSTLKSKPESVAETPSSTGAPLYSRVPMRFPSALKNRLICFQQLWRSASVKERLQDLAFKYVWEALELYRERQATRDTIAVGSGKKKELQLRDFPRVAAATAGSISMAQFEAVAEATTSEKLVDLATACRIVTNAIVILASRSLVQRVTIPEGGDVVVIGDLHGQMKDLREIRTIVGALPNRLRYFVFNGDFVDRGENGMEVILYIFSLLCAFPEFVFINRGNHEDSHVNTEYGFETEVYTKYGLEDAKHLLELLVTSYEAMPLMTVLDGAVLILHGGVPRSPVTLERIEGMSRIRNIPLSAQTTDEEQIVVDILWNDPVEKFRSRQLGLRHQGDNWRTSKRGCGVEYLSPVTENFLRLNNLKLVVRSHEMVHAGYELIHNGRCCTVFSASNYAGVSGNRAALALFQKGSLNPVFHTWYMREEEEEVDGMTMGNRLMMDLEAPGILSIGNQDDDDDDNSTKPDDSTSAIVKNVSKSDGILSEEKNDFKVDDKLKSRSGNSGSSVSSLDLDVPVEGQLLYRLNVLRTLGEIIYRKRYALLSAFVSADYKQSGIILKIEWCDVMRNVLEMDLSWYYLCQFIVDQEEVDGVFCVRYVPFLKNFGARFSTQYLRPFQVAVVCRIFRGMDMPDDLLSRIQAMNVSTTVSIPHAVAPSSLAGEGEDVLYSGNTETHALLKPKINSFTKGEVSTSLQVSRHADAMTEHNTDNGKQEPEKGQKRVEQHIDSYDKWRDLKLSFNLFVTTLRSQSPVAAAFEDNVMYAMFLYFDVNGCGHVFLGDLNDIVGTTLEQEEMGSVELLSSTGSLHLEFDFGTSHNPNYGVKRITDKDASKDADAIVNVLKKEEPKSGRDYEVHLPSLVIACDESNTGRRKSTRDDVRRCSSSLDTLGTDRSNMSEALWLYPALLRLHEYLDYGTLWSLPHIFKCLNRTNDGKLTFEQLNIALQLVGRHMPEPFTPEQCQSIFRAIRDGGELLYRNRHSESFVETRSLCSSESSAPTLTSESLLRQSETDVAAVVPHAYITPEEFVAFFAVSVIVPRRRGSYGTAEGSRTMGPDEVVGGRRWGARSGGGSGGVGMWNGGSLVGWTVGALAARFDAGVSLPQALHDLGLAPPPAPMPHQSLLMVGGNTTTTTATIPSLSFLSPNESECRVAGEQAAVTAAADGARGKDSAPASITTTTTAATASTTTTPTRTKNISPPMLTPLKSPELGVRVPVGRRLNTKKISPKKETVTTARTRITTVEEAPPPTAALVRAKTRAFISKNVSSSNPRTDADANTKSTIRSKITVKANSSTSRSASTSTSTHPSNCSTSTSAQANISTMPKSGTSPNFNTNASNLAMGDASTSNPANTSASISANTSAPTNTKATPNANTDVSKASNVSVRPSLDANSFAATDSPTIINTGSATEAGSDGCGPVPCTSNDVLWETRSGFSRPMSSDEYTQSTRGSKENNSYTGKIFSSSLPQTHADAVPPAFSSHGPATSTNCDHPEVRTTASTSQNQQPQLQQVRLPPVRGTLTKGAAQTLRHRHHHTHVKNNTSNLK